MYRTEAGNLIDLGLTGSVRIAMVAEVSTRNILRIAIRTGIPVAIPHAKMPRRTSRLGGNGAHLGTTLTVG